MSNISLIKLADVETTVEMGRTGVYAAIKNNNFPKPLKIGGTSRWIKSEVEAWAKGRLDAAISARNADAVQNGGA